MKITFPMALVLLFIGLKLGHIIDWSWWWVTSPMWIPAAIFLGIMLLLGLVKLIVYACESPEDRKLRELSSSLKAFSKRFERR